MPKQIKEEQVKLPKFEIDIPTLEYVIRLCEKRAKEEFDRHVKMSWAAWDSLARYLIELKKYAHNGERIMGKEKEVCDIANRIARFISSIKDENKSIYQTIEKIATSLVEKGGYRKADEVRKETAKEILQKWYDYEIEDDIINLDVINLAKQYGVEVE